MQVSLDKKRMLSFFRIRRLPLEWHDEFNDKVWCKSVYRPSYHNSYHAKSVVKAGQKYLNALTDDLYDPLKVADGIEKWNQIKEKINLETFEKAFELAALYHDTGNIIQKISFKDGRFLPIYFDKYISKSVRVGEKLLSAEERSALVFRTVSENSILKDEVSLNKLVRRLILETKYENKSSGPFGLFVRFCDQIGSSFYNDLDDKVEGLLAEYGLEDPNRTYDINSFINFLPMRAEQLLGKKDLDKALGIYQKKLPKHIYLPNATTNADFSVVLGVLKEIRKLN